MQKITNANALGRILIGYDHHLYFPRKMALEPSDKTLGEWNIRAKARIMSESTHKISDKAIVTVGAISFEQQTLRLMVNCV